MSKAIVAFITAAFALGCGPEVIDDEPEPLGVLEYEHPASAFYRLDRRVEVIPVDPVLSSHGCGFLTDRAYDDLTTTLEALDPSVDYDHGAEDCDSGVDPDGLVHLDGFEHSPFDCGWNCCHPDLLRIVLVYFVVESNLVDQEPVIDGEPYVALEPDQPCP